MKADGSASGGASPGNQKILKNHEQIQLRLQAIKFKIVVLPECFLQAPSGLSMALFPLVPHLAVKLASPQDIPGLLESKRHKHMIKTGLSTTWTGS